MKFSAKLKGYQSGGGHSNGHFLHMDYFEISSGYVHDCYFFSKFTCCTSTGLNSWQFSKSAVTKKWYNNMCNFSSFLLVRRRTIFTFIIIINLIGHGLGLVQGRQSNSHCFYGLQSNSDARFWPIYRSL